MIFKLFFWGGPGQAGFILGELVHCYTIEKALKAQGWKVILFDLDPSGMRPHVGYEKAYKQWKDYEA